MDEHYGKQAGIKMHATGTLRWIGTIQVLLALGILLAGLRPEANGLLGSILAAVLIGTGVFVGWKLPNQIQLENKRLTEEQRRGALHVLSLYRHDVLNQVQLIKGYMQMQKFDRLHSPVQKLVQDAQRQSQLSSLPGAELAYRLTVRDLSAPLVHFDIHWGKSRFQFVNETEWVIILEGLAQLGEQAVNSSGTPVTWTMLIEEEPQQILIQLDVLGQDVNDTYIKQLMAQFSLNGWSVNDIGEPEKQYRFQLRQAR